MEVSIFPTLARELKEYVEVRLHLDYDGLKNGEAVRAYHERITGSTGIPIYVIVEPGDREKAIAKFENLDLSGGRRFGEFLRKNTGKP